VAIRQQWQLCVQTSCSADILTTHITQHARAPHMRHMKKHTVRLFPAYRLPAAG
jgi:hypothetical protein